MLEVSYIQINRQNLCLKRFIRDILNMLKIKCDINQQDLKRVDLHFVKSE